MKGQSYPGKDGPEILRRLLNEVNSLPKGTIVILFLDEADSALRKRGKGKLEDDRVVNMILTMMDGVEGFKKGIQAHWLLATNYPQLLDEAFVSRSRIVHMPLPTPEELKAYYKKFILQSHRFTPTEALDLDEMVKHSKDFSYRDAESTVAELERHLIIKSDVDHREAPQYLEFDRRDLLQAIETVTQKKDHDAFVQKMGIKN